MFISFVGIWIFIPFILLVISTFTNISMLKIPTVNIEKTAQLGDTFGVVNALFSGLALSGLIYTIWTERLNNKAQSFENHFFQLLNFHHTIVFDSGGNVNELFDRICQQIKQTCENLRNAKSQVNKEVLVETYKRNYKMYHAVMSHYFRNLEHMIKYIDESEIDNKNKYYKILFSQLSEYEIILLAYHGLTDKGSALAFRDYIIDHKLLKELDHIEHGEAGEILKVEYTKLSKSSK